VIAIFGSDRNVTNGVLAARWRSLGFPAQLVHPGDAARRVGAGDVVVGRLDVTDGLDGVEPGLLELLLLERAGVDVRNGARALLAAHDKLRTARLFHAAGLPHPRSGVVRGPTDALPVPPPLVVKPRFGSWGRDVFRCETEREARACLRSVAGRGWFGRHGAIVQELVEPPRSDLRLIVARGRAVGAVSRLPKAGEWRTNAALGASRERSAPDAAARALAAAAARAIGADLIGIDLLPLRSGGYVVLEANGAADFDATYSFGGRDVFREAAGALGLRREAAVSDLRAGDEIAVARSGHAAGAHDGAGHVLEVLEDPRGPLLRVRWPEGHETIYRPGPELKVVRRRGRRERAAA
jgi:[lysine-biosynthesis-protein LysW]---L-2-aminoadipate ligase